MSCQHKFQARSIDLNVSVIILLAPLTPLVVTPPALRSRTGKPSKMSISSYHYVPFSTTTIIITTIITAVVYHIIVVVKTLCFSSWSYFSFLFCSSGGYTSPTRKTASCLKIGREMCHAAMKISHLQITIRTMK